MDEKTNQKNEYRAFVPFIYLDYLAVRLDFQNQKIGTVLLANALSRCGRFVRSVGVFGIGLHAITERVASLYERYGFRPYDETKRIPFMILPVRTLIDLTADEYGEGN